MLDESPGVEDASDGVQIERARGEIAFEHVTFGYEDGPAVLRDISFHTPAGIRVGVAGRTGAGKSTLVNLITRLYDPVSGVVRLDGRPLPEYRLRDLRKQFSIVTQEPILFSTTVAENIEYGRPGADRDLVVAAARAANAHDFIMELPDGYHTLVGERGLKLSGGERQRIALARAFLRDAPILILDEPTSAVDMRTEADIVEAMQRLMQDRTTFMIAHRLSTLESCDRLMVLEDGGLNVYDSDVEAVIAQALDLGSLEAAMESRR